ncbi:dihydroorotate dehydrogenase [Saccharolobus solfataricus]|uniref:Dihydroorotate dehydrogenase B (NAD(+)), catalytic subunit n=3 Tax=Saccharolobus solfataricus TaxID=2287 RepID=PYRDB_SACS2|nr:dihydroorotate dehydrogenase PyrD [Saccharolobus solfataricus]Q9UX04.1 RecName: Full=Dihydroorotate dehydrogenase B (NAD(+)), catalytic subunit; Short=DHOD B; Short=DHODase B; Short=DHOdehase B; AltName: Full=Dihydroorotate oxidase B; AltName: Full=Orotate reductase (NADH) [Saccharolobus solfataricus P2]AAK40921.1 Dihydroorotate dehydrogenase (dihydroorotate oxidase) (DHOdehase) (pyrD) [Saccharolobus solfataricus P2]AKA73951.1 dihydroorotate dehydrogenase [Saccharolobus solfataricus]AKA76648
MITIKNITLNDPLIIASGIIPDVPNYVETICEKYKPSAITTKTVTLNPLEPHKPPTVIKLHDGIYMNAIGLGNPGAKAINEIGVLCPLIVSVGGSSINEIKEVVEVVQSKAKIIEINVSSPNRKGYGESLSKLIGDIIESVKSVTKLPVFVKLGPWDNVIELAGKALEKGADGLTLINTIKGLIIDVETFKPILYYGTGGVSGRCLYPIALRIIKDVYEEYGVDIIGVGGVYDWTDVIGMLAAGAKLVGLGTVLIEKGFSVIEEIRKGLQSYLLEKGLKFEDIIGISVRK